MPVAAAKTCPKCRQICNPAAHICARCHYRFSGVSLARVLLLIFGILGGLALVIVTTVALQVRETVTSTGGYSQGLQIAEKSPEARRLLGDRIHPGWPIGSVFTGLGSQFVEWSVPISGTRGGAHLYGVANLIDRRWEFSRLVITSDRGSRMLDLAPLPQRAAVPAVPPGKVYLVPFGLDSNFSLAWAPAYYRAKFGVDVAILPPLAVDRTLIDRSRNQLNAEDSLAALRQKLPVLASDPSAVIIAVTSRDLYIPAFNWTYAENFRDDGRFGIVSTARFHPPSWLDRLNPQWFQSRVQKMLTKNVAILYFGLPLSADYTSLLSSGVLNGFETDLMTGSIVGVTGHWAPLRSEGEPEVAVYHAPGKAPYWRTGDFHVALPDTSSQVFIADLANGLLMQRQTDFYFGGQFPLQFTRVYKSFDRQSRAFGVGTDASLNTFFYGRMDSYVNLCFADGSKIHFAYAPQQHGPRETYLTTDGDYIKNVLVGDTWVLSRTDGAKLYLPYRPNARGEYVTVLTGYTDRSGHLYRMERNPAGDLLSITTPAGDSLRFQYDAQHRIQRIEASTGRVVNYQYDPQGRLTRVSDSENQVETYTYDDKDEMLTASDSSGTPFLTDAYDISGKLISQTMQDGGAFKYDFTQDPDSYRESIVPSLMIDPRGLYTCFQYGPDGYSQSLPSRPPH